MYSLFADLSLNFLIRSTQNLNTFNHFLKMFIHKIYTHAVSLVHVNSYTFNFIYGRLTMLTTIKFVEEFAWSKCWHIPQTQQMMLPHTYGAGSALASCRCMITYSVNLSTFHNVISTMFFNYLYIIRWQIDVCFLFLFFDSRVNAITFHMGLSHLKVLYINCNVLFKW